MMRHHLHARGAAAGILPQPDTRRAVRSRKPPAALLAMVAPSGIGPAGLGAGNVGVAFGPVNFTVGAGSAPITWSIVAGALPPGMTFTAAGVYSGTPTLAGNYAWTVRASNAKGSESKAYAQVVT